MRRPGFASRGDGGALARGLWCRVRAGRTLPRWEGSMSSDRICLSTWSLTRDLGPLRLTQRDAAGRKVPWVRENPERLALLDVAAEARRRLGVDRLEICQMHIPSRESAYLDALARSLDAAGASV